MTLAMVGQSRVVTPEANSPLVNRRAFLSSLLLPELIGAFLAAQDVSHSSRDTYGRQIKQFIAWLKDTSRMAKLNSLQREDIIVYRDYLKYEAGEAGQGLSSYSVSGYMTSVRKLFSWLEAQKVYPNIARDVKGCKRANGHKKDTLSPQQLRKALAGIDTGSLEGLRDYAMFNLMARTGLRTIELARAQVGDIRRVDGEPVLWVKGKGRDDKDEFVLLTPEAQEPIQAYLEARGQIPDGAPLFCSASRRNYGEALTTRSISRVAKRALIRAGLDDKRLTAHSLRHTAITLAILGGASLQQAQAMARHSDPRTTMVYFHNLDRVANGAEKFIQF